MQLNIVIMMIGLGLAQGSEHSASIAGVVRFDGNAPARVVMSTEQDPVCASFYQDQPYLSEGLIINENKTLRNALVYVVGDALVAHTWPLPSEPAVLTMRKCRNEPFMLGIRFGQTLKMVNKDNTGHNVNCNLTAHCFNYGFPPERVLQVLVDTPKLLPAEFRCDVHPWHSSFGVLIDHPFFDVSDEMGRFEITGLPEGEYVVFVWHQLSTIHRNTQRLTLRAGEQADITLTTRPLYPVTKPAPTTAPASNLQP